MRTGVSLENGSSFVKCSESLQTRDACLVRLMLASVRVVVGAGLCGLMWAIQVTSRGG